MITSIIHFVRLESKHIGGTSNDTQVATFTSFLVDNYCALYF